ncbi:hypothetical protein [Escherichia coli]|uniref:hypothetical protein n=1 Tax=Escherichia coli TaxID=562 RepID=UPI001592DD45|nr:hypothetical protein [Escherichia coli]
MALKKLPGGVIVETDGGARLNEDAGVNLEAIHRQLAGAAAAALEQAKRPQFADNGDGTITLMTSTTITDAGDGTMTIGG